MSRAKSSRPATGRLAAWARQHWPLLPILLAFVVLGVIYSQSTPVLEGPDEMWHYPYVKHIADGKGLPRQSEEGVKSEYHQPPLYYAIGALATLPLYTDDLEAVSMSNPYWGYRARAPEPDNKAIFLHTEHEAWPYRGATLAIHVVRWISVLMNALTVLGAYLIALEVLPQRRHLAWGTAALVAFTPQFLYLSGTVNNDNLITPLCTLAVWLALGLIKGKADAWRLLGLGALIGLALLTKWTGLALLPLAGLALLYRAWRDRDWARLVREGVLVYGPALLLSGWYFMRNQWLYGDPLGIGRKMEIFAPRHPQPTLRELIAEIPRKELSYWASFGWENVYADPWVYPILRLLVYIGLLGLFALAIRHWRARRGAHTDLDSAAWAQLGLLATWSALVLALFVRWMIYTEAAVGRHLFPAMAGNMFFILLGWTWPLSPRWASRLTSALTLALFALALVAPFRYIRPTYAPPPRYTLDQMPAIANPLDVNYGDRVRLLGYELSSQAAKPGDTVHVTFYWLVLDRMAENYSVFIHFLNAEGDIVTQRDSHPGLGNYVTSRWRPGEVIQDTYPVPIPAWAAAPARLEIMAGFYLLANMQRLPMVNDAPSAHDAARIGDVDLIAETR